MRNWELGPTVLHLGPTRDLSEQDEGWIGIRQRMHGLGGGLQSHPALNYRHGGRQIDSTHSIRQAVQESPQLHLLVFSMLNPVLGGLGREPS